MWFSKRKQIPPPLNILDEVADAITQYRTECVRPRLPIRSRDLSKQFQLPITPGVWTEIGNDLQCPLPPLTRTADGWWMFPNGWTQIDDVVKYVSQNKPGMASPQRIDEAAWADAQVFVRVRRCFMYHLGVEKEVVHRSARLIEDLDLV